MPRVGCLADWGLVFQDGLEDAVGFDAFANFFATARFVDVL